MIIIVLLEEYEKKSNEYTWNMLARCTWEAYRSMQSIQEQKESIKIH